VNLLFASDFHILERDLSELESIFAEIIFLKDKHCINKIIIPGDSFDSIKPTSKELDCLSSFITKLNIPVVLLAANSHESSTPEESVINHFGLLNDKIMTCKEYKDENRLYVGHFIVTQSSKNFGGTVDKNDLRNYKFVVLGHGHNFEIIKPNILQLGSVRFVDFGEDTSIKKKIAICTHYNEQTQKWHFVDLNSYIPMINVNLAQNDVEKDSPEAKKDVLASSGKQSQAQTYASVKSLCSYLDSLNAKTKVRVIFKDYDLYREFLPVYESYKNKFVLFKDRKDFIMSCNSFIPKLENISLKESAIKFFEVNKVPEAIRRIIMEEFK
jgi:DNA repair exonuclease SbcCD nuclease subunit